MARDRLAQRLARQGAPYRRYGPQCRGYARSVDRQLFGRQLSDHQLPFGVDEHVLSMNAEAEQQRSVAVIDVRFAAIAGARQISEGTIPMAPSTPTRQLFAVGCGARDGAPAEAGERPAWRAGDHLAQSRRLAKKRALAIQYSRGKAQKEKLYRELIAATRATGSTLERAVQRLAAGATIEAELWLGQVRHYLPLIERIIAQAERRVLAGEAVPSGEKLVMRHA